MAVNVKKLVNSIVCAAAGLFNFIFMFLNYAVVFATNGGASESKALNAYETLELGDESLSNAIELFMGMFGKNTTGAFFFDLTAVSLILMTVVSAALIICGTLGFIFELTHVNQKATHIISKIFLMIYFISAIVTSSVFSLACLMNLYIGDIYYSSSIIIGVRPGIGLFMILSFAIAAWIVFCIFEKKSSHVANPNPSAIAAKPVVKPVVEPIAVSAVPLTALTYKCSSCGAKCDPEDKFCGLCGGAVISSDESKISNSVNNTYIAQNTPSNETVISAEACAATVPAEAALPNAEVPAENSSAKIDEAPEGNNVVSSTIVPNAPKEPAKKKGLPLKLWIIIGVAALTVIGIVILLLCLLLPKDSLYVVPKTSISYIYNESDDETYILVDGEKFKKVIDGDIVDYEISLDGETMILVSEYDVLYAYRNNTLTQIEKDISDYKVSAEGSAVLYINDYGELILYSISDKESKKLTSEVPYNSRAYYYISPDGESVAYAEGDADDYILYVYKDGKKTRIDRNFMPLGLSDDAELLYYYNENSDTVYVVKNNKDPEKLIGNFSSYEDDAELLYNADHTQVIFYNGTNYYISENGKERHKISSKEILQFADYDEFGITIYQSQYSSTLPVNDFKEQYFIDASYTLRYINNKFEVIEIADDVDYFKVTESGSMIYYLDDYGDLYRSSGYNKKFERIADDVVDFVITSNGKACYYIDDDDTLMYAEKANQSEKIADDIYRLCITHDDYALFVTDYSSSSGGTLYSSHNGSTKQRIGRDVIAVYTTPVCTYYYQWADDYYDSYSVYAATKKIDFKLVVKEIDE